MPQDRFTFAIVGRDEARTLPGVIAEARAAAQRGDQIVFVDSASIDDSAARAQSLGIEVWSAPEGKGNAIAAALERCETRYVCFLDADHFHWSVNVPGVLRASALESRAGMVVGSYREDRRRVIQPFVYWPLVDELFPDWGRQCDPTPLSGLRVIDTTVLPQGPLPPGYGVEAHLNLAFAADGARIEVIDVGVVQGPLRGYANLPGLAQDIVAAILDFALACGRLDAVNREGCEKWLGRILDVLAHTPPPGAEDREFLASLATLAARPLPAAGPQPAWAPTATSS